MDTEEEFGSAIDKSRFLNKKDEAFGFLNKKDEAFGFLCLSISQDLLFLLLVLKTPKKI